MDVATLQSIRRLVLDTVSQLDGRSVGPAALLEKPLQFGPKQRGCRFQCRDIRAVWFVDGSAIDFFSDDGHLLASVPSPDAAAEPLAA